jgi:hypothetical protein
MLVSPYPWPTNSAGQLETFDEFTGNTFSRDTRDFVDRLTEEQAVPSEWAVDNYEDTYPNDAPAMVPETVRNTTTEVGLWLARNAPVYARGDHGEGVICVPLEVEPGDQHKLDQNQLDQNQLDQNQPKDH